MKKHLSKVIIIVAFLLMWGLVLLLCNAVMSTPASDTVFAFNDGNIEGALSMFHYPEAILRCWDNQSFFGTAGGALPLSLNAIFESLFGPVQQRRAGVIATILLTAMASFWTMRQFSRSIYSSLTTSLLLLLCGWNFTFPLAGLTVRSLALMWCMLSVGMIEKARKSHSLWLYATAGGLLGLALSETLDVGAIFALACGGYFFMSHIPYKKGSLSRSDCTRNASGLALYIAATAFIAYQTLVVVGGTTLRESSGDANTKTPAQQYAWATQWSLPKAETWSLIACDYHGASSRSQTSPYWGGMGRSEGWKTTKQGFRNFRLAGYALGSLPFVTIAFLIVYLVISRKNSLFEKDDRKIIITAMGVAAICLMLSWGKHFPLYRLFYSLPKMSAIRNPDKWLGPFTLFFGIVFAYSLDAFLYGSNKCSDEERKRLANGFVKASIIIPLIAGITLMYIVTASGVFISDLQSEGYGKTAANALRNAIQADVTALIVSSFCIAALWFFSVKKRISSKKTRTIIVAVAALLISFELGRATLPFVIGHPYGHLNKPNPLTDYLNRNKHNGRIKLMTAQHPLINNWRMSYLMAKGYDIFDPHSIRQMPTGLQQFLDSFSQNPIRLWQMGSMRYFLCSPEAAQQLSAVKSGDNNLFAKRLELSAWQTKEGTIIPVSASATGKKYVELLEFLPALPLFRFVPEWRRVEDNPAGDKAVLARLAAPDFNPAALTHLHDSSIAPSGKSSTGNLSISKRDSTETTIRTSRTDRGILVRSERYKPDWKAYIDDKPTKIMRADYLFQAIVVPSGNHEVRFRYEPSHRPLAAAVAGRFLLIILILCGMFLSHWKKPT